MRKTTLIATLCLFSLGEGAAHAQQFDVAFGMNGLTAPSASSASGNHFPQSLTGGAYPSFSGTFLLMKHFGVNGEVSWRGGRSLYGGDPNQPYRPIFYDFNAVYAPRLSKSIGADLMAGIGAESIRIYQPFSICGAFGCTNYVSSNHFLGHFGGGIRYYVWGNVFLRPEAHLYLVNNNNEFSSARATRFGVSIGYTFGLR